jgi:apolipoprotein N-acyltransferase
MNYLKIAIFTLSFIIFIYFEHFGFSFKILNTLLGLIGFLLLFTLSRKELFVSGTLIGVFWFWWIGYSFVYYDLQYLVPIVIIAIGIGYGLLFAVGGYFNNPYLKALYFFLFSFIEPFGFNWFKLELIFINSYIGIQKLELFIILLVSAFTIDSISRFQKNKSAFYLYPIVIVTMIIYNNFNQEKIVPIELKIKQHNTYIKQSEKWKKQNQEKIVNENFQTIQKAIDENYELIILPETAFPFILNNATSVLDKLSRFSDKIAIITGSLYQKDSSIYNSTYLFNKGTVQIANKVVLVPFGEAVPFPQMIRNWINDTFYNGAQDYAVADKPTTFTINNTKFRNAICYEATTDRIFEDLDTQYMIAISNNAWFLPSHQPTLQKLLMQYYEKKYNVKIISVTNQ